MQKNFQGVLSFWVGGVLMAAGMPATAEICSLDAVPAATLLLPYFEVTPDEGVDTLFSVNNASPEPALAHVTFWTDASVPTLDFSIYLTGYDVVTVRLSDVFTAGSVPSTSFDSFPAGAFSLPNAQFPGCEGQLPLPDLPANFIRHIQNAHSGMPSDFFGGLCSSVVPDEGTYRGYVTIDSVSACSLSFPDTPGYFVNGGGGIANNANVLWGDYFLTDSTHGFAQGDNLVHIEASSTDPRVTTPGSATFYRRYVAANADDNREPLATAWAIRYLNGGAFSGGSDVICWQDSRQIQNPFLCGTAPFSFPAGVTFVAFDEDENVDVAELPPFSPVQPLSEFIPCFFEANRTDSADYVVADTGWLYVNFLFPFAQGFVSQLHRSGEFSVGYAGVALDSACNPNPLPLRE